VGEADVLPGAYSIDCAFCCDREWTPYMYHPIPWHGVQVAAISKGRNVSGIGRLSNIRDHEPEAGHFPTGGLTCSVLAFRANWYKKSVSRSESCRAMGAERRHMAVQQSESGSLAATPARDTPVHAAVGEVSPPRIRSRNSRSAGKLHRNVHCSARSRFAQSRNRRSGMLQRTLAGSFCPPYYLSSPARCDRDLTPSVNSGEAVVREQSPTENGTLDGANPWLRGRHGCAAVRPGGRERCGGNPLPDGCITRSARLYLRLYGAVLVNGLGSGQARQGRFSTVSLIGQRYSIDIAGPGR
jgi:hypothetical protein